MKLSFGSLLFLSLLTGCLVGPNYHPPNPPMPAAFTEAPSDGICMDPDKDLATWWRAFKDPFLEELLHESVCKNFDLRIAVEQIAVAKANYWTQFTAILPEFDYSILATRSRTSQTLGSSSAAAALGPPIQNFYEVELDAIWELDFFGGLRRAARSAYNTLQATLYDAQAVRIMVLAEVAMTYVNICAFQQSVAISELKVALDEQLVTLAFELLKAGLGDEQDLLAFQATLEADRAALNVFQVNLGQAVYSLAPLVGRPPETFPEQFACARPIPNASGLVPPGLPSQLLCRRPDVRSAERRLAASTEQIGVAVADLYPSFSLTGNAISFSANPLQGANIGFASSSLSKLFQAASSIWGIGILATGFLFDFGKRSAAIDMDVALRNQDFLTYEKTVITALQEVESDLVAYFKEGERLGALTRDAIAYQRIVDLTLSLYRAGLTPYTQVLEAEENWYTAALNQIGSQQALAIDLIALYKALGGGWECCSTP
jgi:outer membrane protein, multidrug efflux system